ncbi:unnamed protein product [Arabidopsis halleri]
MTTHESQIGVALISEQRSSHYKKTFKSLGSLPSTDAILIIDHDDGEEVSSYLEPKNDNELSNVVKGLLKSKDDDDAQYRVDWWFSSTDIHEDKTEKKTKKKNEDGRSISTPPESAMGSV